MPNNIFEQFEEIYSRWSVLDKARKGMQLTQMWQQVNATYNYILQIYQNRGYLTTDEASYANQLQQLLLGLQVQKAQVDQELTAEMIKHLMKMKKNQ